MPLTIPLLKVSLSQLTASSAGVRVHTRLHARACTRAHLKTSQLMGLNLINCSETDTLSLINPFLRHCAHGKSGDNTTQAHTETHKHAHIYGEEGDGEIERGRERRARVHSHRWKNMVICQGDSTLKHPNYTGKATLFWCWIKCE